MSLGFRVLGEVGVAVDGAPASLRPMERRVLAVLLARHNRPVRAERLVDMVWGQRPPRTAAAALRVHVDRLRTAMQKNRVSRLVWSDGTYRLVLEPEELDLCRFEDALRRGRETAVADPTTACGVLRQGLGEWGGTPFGEIEGIEVIESTRSYLERRRSELLVELAEVELAAGRHHQVAADLRRWCDESPDSEALAAALVVALYRCGDQVAALEVCRRTMRRLAQDYGLDAGPRLRRIEAQVLAQDPALAAPAALAARAATAHPTPLGRADLIRRVTHLVTGPRRPTLVVLVGPPGIGVSTVLQHLAIALPGAVALADLPDDASSARAAGAAGVADLVESVTDAAARVLDQLAVNSIDTLIVDEGDQLTADRCSALVDAVRSGLLRTVITAERAADLPELLAMSSGTPAVRVEVGELAPDAARELVASILGPAGTVAQLIPQVLTAAGGHPLLLATLARQALVDGSVLAAVDVVDSLVGQWTRGLPARQRQVVLDAVVDLGEHLDLDLAARAGGLDEAEVSAAAQALLASGLATPASGGVCLRHEAFREALRRLARPWGPRHERLARALVEAAAPEQAARTLHHVRSADDEALRSTAWRWAQRAAQDEERAGSWREASGHWQMAADVLQEAATDVGGDDQAHSAALAQVRLGHANALAMIGDLQQAHTIALDVLRAARRAGRLDLAAHAAVHAVTPWVPTGATARRCQQVVLDILELPCAPADRVRLIEAGLRASRTGNRHLARRVEALAPELTALDPHADPEIRLVALRGRHSLTWMRRESPSVRRELALDMTVLAAACSDRLLTLEAHRALAVASVECADGLGARQAIDDYVAAATRDGSLLNRWLAHHLARAQERRADGTTLALGSSAGPVEALVDPQEVVAVSYEQMLGEAVRTDTLGQLLPLADLVATGAAGMPGDPMALLAASTVALRCGRDVAVGSVEPLWEALRGGWRGIPAAALLVLAGGLGRDAELIDELAPATQGWVTITGTGDLGPVDVYLALAHARTGDPDAARRHADAALRCAETFAPQWRSFVTRMMTTMRGQD